MEVTKSVILKIINYSDTQKIVHVYSRENGFLNFISPSFIFRKKSCALQPMQVAEIEYYQSVKGDLHKMKSVDRVVDNSAVYFDIYKMNILLLWSEILDLLLKKEQKNENLFDFIVRAVEYLNTTQKNIANFNLFFLYRLVTLLGFRINTDTYSSGYVFNINDGNFVPQEKGNAYISGPHAAGIIFRLCTCKVEELGDIPLNRESRRILLDIILLFFTIHLSIDFNVKSIRVIREIFD